MDVKTIAVETEEESEQLLRGGGRFPKSLLGTLRTGLLGGLPKDMPEAERKEAEKKLDELLASMTTQSPARFSMDSLLRMLERQQQKLADLPPLVLSLAQMLEKGGLDAPHMFKLGGIHESLIMAYGIIGVALKDLRETSECACFRELDAKANEKAAPQ